MVENDNFLHNFMHGTNYYVEVGDVRYPANTLETVTLYDWTSVDSVFMDEEFDAMIQNAALYASINDVFVESVR